MQSSYKVKGRAKRRGPSEAGCKTSASGAWHQRTFGALHQESPEQIVDILKRARRALKPGGQVFVLDMMTDETHTAPAFSALFAVNMAQTTENGWVFSDAELKGWMREAGFTPGETRPVPPPMPHWLVTGVNSNA